MRTSSLLRDVAKNLILAALYAGIAKLALGMGAVAGFATLVWPPTGIALAALLRLGPGLWPGVALGALVANVWTGASVPVASGIAIGNTLEAVLGAYLLRRFVGFGSSLDRLVDVLGLIIFAGLLSTTVSATVGVTSLLLGGVIVPARLPETWSAWWLGDLMGVLVVAPVLLAWNWDTARDGSPGSSEWSLRRFEAVALSVATIIVTLTIFGPIAGQGHPRGHLYLLFPVLIWGTLRFGIRGATATTFLVSAMAIWGTASGYGPFVGPTLVASLFPLQSFMAVVAVTVLILAAVNSERDRAIRQARDAVRGREEVLAVVSHDLSNIVNAIQGGVHVLLMRATQEPGPATALRPIQIIERSAQRMTRLIGDLLDSASLDAGELSLQRAPQDADATLREAIEMMEPSANQKGINLEGRFLGTQLEVVCDRTRLIQVLANLIGNAIKFTREGSVRIGIHQEGEEVRFEVQDSGSGIPADQLAHVFDRYWKGPQSDRAGHGLGLHIAKKIVEAHSGRIWVQSVAGQGSTFFFKVPLRS